MGERKGTNKYYPPDFDPKIHKSLNGYHGVHALRERARKLDRGILIIRFELPYNIWCDGCKIHVAMGVRYNAEKTKVGMYYTTPLWQFKMKCHLCDNYIIIQTDPKNNDYVIVSGAKRKEQRWDMGENEQIVTEEKSDIKRLNTDPMFKLEHEVNDKTKLVKLMPTLVELEETKLKWKDDYSLNSMLRSSFRTEKKKINVEKAKDKEFLDKWNININLVKENEDDIKLASLYKYYSIDNEKNNEILNPDDKRKKIENESIFGNDNKLIKTPKSSSTTSNDSIKTLKIDGLRKKLTKSIQEKKLNNIISSNDSVKKDVKSLMFNIKKSNDNNNESDNKKNKLSNLVIINNNNNNDDNENNCIKGALVSNDYGDDNSNDSN